MLVSLRFARRRFGPYFVEPVVAGATSSHLGQSTRVLRNDVSDSRACGAPLFTAPEHITGLNSKDEPFIAATDLIGCINFAKVRSPPSGADLSKIKLGV